MAKFQKKFLGGGVIKTENTQSARKWLNFNLGGGEGYSTVLRVGYSQNFEPNFQPLQQAHASQIVSHILRVETNELRIVLLTIIKYNTTRKSKRQAGLISQNNKDSK